MKNQLKKSLSLLMAVIMLMSCWVWIAPDKAEAGADTGTYPVTFKFKVTNQSEGDSKCLLRFVVTYTTNNGTGTSATKTYDLNGTDSRLKTEGTQHSWEVDVPGYPTQIVFSVRDNAWQGFGVEWNDLLINGKDVWDEKYTRECDGWFASDWSDTATVTPTSAGAITDTWVKPFLSSAEATVEPSSHTLAKINTGINSTSTITLSNLKDNYDVKWIASSTPSFTLRVDDGITLGSNATIAGSGNSRTVTIKPWFQTLYPGKQNAKLYIDWSVTGGTGKVGTKTETITVDFPTYTATFYGNGGKISDDGSTLKDEIVVSSDRMTYGSLIGSSPAFRQREGFDFMGFYSTDENNVVLGKDAYFTGTKFEDRVTLVPDTGDTEWYAAWQASPVTATFVTADNQKIAEVVGRNNNYLTANNMYQGESQLANHIKTTYDAYIAEYKAAIENGEADPDPTMAKNLSFSVQDGVMAPDYKDGATTYIFEDWKIIEAYDDALIDKGTDTLLYGDVTFQAVYRPASAATYTVSFKNAEGVVISKKEGYKYRDDVTGIPSGDSQPTLDQNDVYRYEFIGWANDIGKKYYTVDENDCDENGAKIVYTHKDGAEFVVKGDASYVPVFRMIPREYKVTYNYTKDGGGSGTTTIEGYYWDETVRMPEIKDNYTAGGFRNFLQGWKVNGTGSVQQLEDIKINGDMTLTAVYGNPEVAKYTINFYGKDTDGVTDILLNGDNNIYEHNSPVAAPGVSQNIDTGDSLYTFTGWSPTVIAAAGGDVNYYAQYTKQDYANIYFYNYDGTLLEEKIGSKDNTIFVDGIVPAYTGETPVREEDPVGTYTFSGWADSNGNEVDPGTSTINGDTYLYAQFETNYTDYTVKFMNGENVVSEQTYHYGVEIAVPTEEPTKAEDEEFIYDFKAWSPDISRICLGDATYEAEYNRTYQYYTVTWFKEKKGTILTENNYRYNTRIQPPIYDEPEYLPGSPDGYEWAFYRWVECDENGEKILVDGKEVVFVNGRRIGAEHLYFYPEFVLREEVFTVNFYQEDGTTWIGAASIPYGETLGAYDAAYKAKAGKDSDETYHYIIDRWADMSGENITYDGDKVVSADLNLKATYTAVLHDNPKPLDTHIAAPTCNVPGYGYYKCEAEECTLPSEIIEIPVVADTAAPAGQIYVGSNKWTLDDYTTGIDYNDIRYVSPNTTLIANAWDFGSASSPWNVEGKMSSGVSKIQYYVSESVVNDPAGIRDTDWGHVYDYTAVRAEIFDIILNEIGITEEEYNAYTAMQKAAVDRQVEKAFETCNANATSVLSNLNLENGKTYIIYMRVTDRQGNKCYYSSGTISYGTVAPEIAITGEGYGTKFCAEATITVTDDDAEGLVVTIDDETVTLTDGKYICNEKGIHTVVAVDRNGNKTSKTFEIKGNHSYKNYIIAETCTKDGSSYDICSLCGHKDNIQVRPMLGHNYSSNFVDTAPTCIDNGYRTYVCENNCGENVVVYPTDAAEILIDKQVKKLDENGDTVDLTPADLAYLRATGKHTFEKVKDENGLDTDEDVWVIDVAPTCKDTGSKHKDCIKCGYTEEAPISEDTENGHKFYRIRTVDPTCTTDGSKTQTCRYCGFVKIVEILPALGHTAGDYVEITAPTCDTAGSQILTCAECDAQIGEPIKDADGNIIGFDGNAIEIPATDHAWRAEGLPFRGDKLDEDGSVVYDEDGNAVQVWYQKYVCAINNEHTKNKELEDYVAPEKATLTFTNGDAVVKTIECYVNDVITAAQVTERPEKAEDATYRYTFSHWADAEGNEVTFPINVEGDATYNAVFAERYKNYTITYFKEVEKMLDNGTITTEIVEHKKTGYLHNGDVEKLADAPSKAETSIDSYKFVGWVLMGSDPEVIYTDTATINGADINLLAKYEAVKKQYAVTYAYSSSNIIHTYLVEAGTKAPDARADFVVEKLHDTKNHYVFKAWNREAQLASVESNIYTTPDFTPVLHSYRTEDGGSIEEITAATCTSNAVNKYTCACGYTYNKEVSGTATGHSWNDPVTENGNVTRTCKYCGAVDQNTESFTLVFYSDTAGTVESKTISYVKWGTSIDATRLPAAPKDYSDATTDYTFSGWAIKGTEEVIDVTALVIKQDYEFVAIFDETIREYSVVFAYDGNNIIKTFTKVPAGSSVSFVGATPEKAFDATYHYTFSNWAGYAAGSAEAPQNITITDIQSNLYILAEFAKEKHSYTESSLGEPTCQNGSGTRYTCSCGKFYDVAGKPLDHNYVEIARKEATPNSNGFIKYECQNIVNGVKCGATKEETLTYNDNTMEIKVYVEHNNAPKSGIKVEIQDAVTGAVEFATTNANGYATFTVDQDGAYTCYVENDGKHQVTLVKEGKGYVGTYSYTDQADCTCACHRDNVWGAIFRFFHKIIKFITGEFKCCGNPDPMYG